MQNGHRHIFSSFLHPSFFFHPPAFTWFWSWATTCSKSRRTYVASCAATKHSMHPASGPSPSGQLHTLQRGPETLNPERLEVKGKQFAYRHPADAFGLTWPPSRQFQKAHYLARHFLLKFISSLSFFFSCHKPWTIGRALEMSSNTYDSSCCGWAVSWCPIRLDWAGAEPLINSISSGPHMTVSVDVVIVVVLVVEKLVVHISEIGVEKSGGSSSKMGKSPENGEGGSLRKGDDDMVGNNWMNEWRNEWRNEWKSNGPQSKPTERLSQIPTSQSKPKPNQLPKNARPFERL